MSIQTRILSNNTLNSLNSNSEIPALYLFNQYNRERYPYLLLSSANRKNNTQFDILIACPQYKLTLDADHKLHCSNEKVLKLGGFLETLEHLFQQNKSPVSSESENLPFTGGWFVYLAYEMAEEVEPCLSLPKLS